MYRKAHYFNYQNNVSTSYNLYPIPYAFLAVLHSFPLVENYAVHISVKERSV